MMLKIHNLNRDADMDIRHLNYFIAVAQLKSFTKAADYVHISQSALSKAVKSLELELNVELFDRSSKKIQLTDAGEIVLIESLKIKEALNELSTQLYDLMNLEKGSIKIGLPPIIGFLFFPKIIKQFNARYPEILIKLSEDGAENIKQEIQDGLLDLGIVILPVDEEEFDVIPFIDEELMLFVSHDNPLAQYDEIEIKQLSHERFIVFKQGFALHDKIIHECIRAGFHPKIAYECSEWEFMSGLIGENLGISIFPRPVIDRIDRTKIKPIRIINPVFPWKLGFVSKKDKYKSYAVKEFFNFIHELSVTVKT